MPVRKSDIAQNLMDQYREKIQQLCGVVDREIHRQWTKEGDSVSVSIGHYPTYVINQVMEIYSQDSIGWTVTKVYDQKDGDFITLK